MTLFARLRSARCRVLLCLSSCLASVSLTTSQLSHADEPKILPALTPPAAADASAPATPSLGIVPYTPDAPIPPPALSPPANDAPPVAPESTPATRPAGTPAKSYAVRPPLIDMAESMIAESLPRSYSDARHWEKQKHFTTGLDVGLDGLRLDTARRKKLLNHGTWKRYDVWLPEGQKLVLDVTDVRTFDDGRVAFRVTATGPLKGRIEVQQWERGVRLVGISADCEAKVRLTLDVEAALTTKQGTLLPTVAVAQGDGGQCRDDRFSLTPARGTAGTAGERDRRRGRTDVARASPETERKDRREDQQIDRQASRRPSCVGR